MGVGVQRERDARVAQLLLDDTRMHALAEHDAGVHVAQILDSQRWQSSPLQGSLKAAEHDIGLNGATVGLGKDEVHGRRTAHPACVGGPLGWRGAA